LSKSVHNTASTFHQTDNTKQRAETIVILAEFAAPQTRDGTGR